MSDTKKPAETSPDQDLADQANNATKQRNAFSEDDVNTQSSSRLDEADRSLGALHTGDQSQHEEVVIAQTDGAPEGDESAERDETAEQGNTDTTSGAIEAAPGELSEGERLSSDSVASDIREESRELDDGGSDGTEFLQATELDFSEGSVPPEAPASLTTDIPDEAAQGQPPAEDPEALINAAPENLEMDRQIIAEDASVGDVVGTVSAADPEGDTLSYSLSDDANGMFTIDADTGEIKVAGGLDFETTENYSVTVDVSDGENVTQQTFTLNVGDVNEAAHSVELDNNSVSEDASVGDVVGTVSAADPEGDTLSYSLSDDADGMFTIDADTGEIKVAGGLDFETTENYSVTVDVSDGENVTQQTFTLNVGDVNEAAHSVELDNNSVSEDASVGDVVGTVSAADPEGDTLSYSLSDDADGTFTIDANTGEIKVAGGLDFESTENYSVTVDVSDGENVTQQTFTLNVGDVNEGPAAGDVDLGATLEDNSVQFTSADLLANSTDVDGDDLSITGVTVDAAFGTVTEVAPGQFEFSPTEHFSGEDIPFSFTVSDGEYTATATASLDVTAVSDAPDLSVSLVGTTRSTIDGAAPENVVIDASNVLDADSGFTVTGRIINDDGTLSDPSADYVSNDGGRIGITGYNDAIVEQIGSRDIAGGASEELIVDIDGSATSAEVGFSRLFSNEGGDGHHEQGFYTLYQDGEVVGSGSFTAEDGKHTGTAEIAAEDGSAFDQIVFSSNHNWTGHEDGTGDSDYFINSIQIETEVEDIPVNLYELNISADLVDVDGSENLSVVTISDIPADAILSAGDRNEDGSWTVDVQDLDGLVLTVPADMSADFDISVSVAATDGSADPATSIATLTIPKIEYSPEQVGLDNNSIAEDASVGDVVGVVNAIDINGDALSYSLSDDADGMFTIDANTGEIKVAGGLDFETTENYSVTVDVSDGENVTQQTFTLNVGDVNEAAHSVELDNNSVSEDASVGDVVGTVSAADPEGDTLSYSLSDDAGGMFTIDADTGEIKVAGGLDFETTENYSVTVDVSDGENVTQQTFTLNVGDVNEAAHSVELDNNSVSEDASVGDVVGTVSAADPEGDTLSYSLSDDADGMFTIDANTGEIKVAGGLDFETTENYSVTVDVSDGENVTQQTFTLNVGDVNEAVHSVSLDDNSVNESAGIGDVVGSVAAIDPENEALSYTLTDDADGMFTIDAATGEIKVAGPLDYETTTNYEVSVEVSDGTHTATETFTINIDDNLSPVLSGGGNEIEIQQVGDAVDLSNMDVFPELNTAGDVEARVGTEVFEDMVSDAENLTINYQSEVTVTFEGEIAGYRNSIGAYQINSDGTLTGAELLWGDASSDKLEAGVSTATYDGIETGATLGFFVISNGFGKLPDEAYSGDGNSFPEEGSWMFVSPDFNAASDNPEDHLYNINTDNGVPKLVFVEADGTVHTQSGDVFHSTNQEEFNPDSNEAVREHFIAGVDQDNGILNFGFEDTKGGGDHDFNDGMFSAEIDVRDLMEAPNPLFSRDEQGRSSFEIEDLDSGELQQVVITVSDVQDGDALSLSGPYKIVDGMVQTYDGQDTGIAISMETEEGTTTLTLSGEGDLDHYEAIVQNINFSNTSGSHDIAGDRPITVVATDSGGEVSAPLDAVFTIAMDEAVHSVGLDNDSIAEDASEGTVLGTVSAVDPEGRDLTYTLSDTAGGRFEIDTSTGEIRLAGSLDYETADSHQITVGVSDGVNTTYEMFTINVGDVEEGTPGDHIEGTNKADNLTGTENDDYIDAWNGDDVVYGLGGNDTIEGDNHEDLIYGGSGDDNIDGGRHDDTLYGQSGDDNISGGHHDDLIYGQSGNDTIDGGKHDDTIFGGSGEDLITGGQGDDVVYGEAGNDIFEFGLDDGMDTFSGGVGGGWSDTIVLSDGAPSGEVGDWLTLTSGSIESTEDGEIFLSEDAAGTITLDDNAVLTFEGVEKIEG